MTDVQDYIKMMEKARRLAYHQLPILNRRVPLRNTMGYVTHEPERLGIEIDADTPMRSITDDPQVFSDQMEEFTSMLYYATRQTITDSLHAAKIVRWLLSRAPRLPQPVFDGDVRLPAVAPDMCGIVMPANTDDRRAFMLQTFDDDGTIHLLASLRGTDGSYWAFSLSHIVYGNDAYRRLDDGETITLWVDIHRVTFLEDSDVTYAGDGERLTKLQILDIISAFADGPSLFWIKDALLGANTMIGAGNPFSGAITH